MILLTDRLELTLQSPTDVLAWVETLPPEVRCELSPVWLDRLKRATGPDVWSCMFRIRLQSAGTEVGSCGFKGPPDESGMVEIAYGIDEPYRNQGFATEAAGALTEYGLSLNEVRVVRANTKSENAASERTLTKNGFVLMGQFEDPEDGWVNRWEIAKA